MRACPWAGCSSSPSVAQHSFSSLKRTKAVWWRHINFTVTRPTKQQFHQPPAAAGLHLRISLNDVPVQRRHTATWVYPHLQPAPLLNNSVKEIFIRKLWRSCWASAVSTINNSQVKMFNFFWWRSCAWSGDETAFQWLQSVSVEMDLSG